MRTFTSDYITEARMYLLGARDLLAEALREDGTIEKVQLRRAERSVLKAMAELSEVRALLLGEGR
jgi:hypothetical protein